jgi:hypothetical protein
MATTMMALDDRLDETRATTRRLTRHQPSRPFKKYTV